MTHRAQKKVAEDGRRQEDKGGHGHLPQLGPPYLSPPQMGPNAKELFRLVEDFVDVIGFRMKDLRDAYQVTDNLGKPLHGLVLGLLAEVVPYCSHR